MGGCSAAGGAGSATTLCTSCGLCCMGVLHHAVLLIDGVIDDALAAGLEAGTIEGRPVFALPCPRLEGTRCGIYDRRPGSCGYYRCQLLRDLDDGKTDLATALHRVRAARAQFDEAKRAMPPGLSLRQAQAIAMGREDHPDATPDLRLRMTALNYYLDRHFRNEDDGKYFIVSDVSPAGDPK